MAQQAVCEKCNGEGAYVVRERHEAGDLVGTSMSTHPCPCRADEPPREGNASWWTVETAFTGTCQALADTATVRVRPEVPMSRDNHRVVMRGNRYWPTLVDLDIEGCGIDASFHTAEARELAALLVKAAEIAERIDNADTEPACGHWAPCDCKR